jgi:DNA-binding beta-propeller fold protein YncE/tetratricopeptide (TPR) repeat protein
VKNICTILIAVLMATASGQTITKLYVPAGAGGDVGRTSTLVYGIETNQLIAELQPSHDAGLAVANSDSSEVWIFGATSTTCDIYGTTTDKLIRTIELERQVVDAVFSPDGKYCFAVGSIPGSGANSLFVIDRATYSVAITLPEVIDPAAVAVSSNSQWLYWVSPSRGTLTKLEIPGFKIAANLFVGFEPSALTITHDGRFVFVVCRGLNEGKRGGSQITVVDTRTDMPLWVLNVGTGCSSVAISPDMGRMAITYDLAYDGSTNNVRLFNLHADDDSISISPTKAFAIGETPQSGMMVSAGRYWIGCDPVAGGVPIIDLSADTVIASYSLLGHPRPLRVAAVSVRIGESIAAITGQMAAESDSSKIPDYYLDLAYLLKTANRKNDMVAAYQKVIDQFPTSFAAISSGLQLADICYSDQLYSQTADFSFDALNSYRRFLAESPSDQRLSQSSLLMAIDRMALFSKQFDKEYLKKLADAYLKLTISSPELAEAFFRMGYHLRRADEGKLANRCFAEVGNQLMAISDPALVQPLSARLALATGDAKAIYKVKEKKKEPTIDGDLNDWIKDKPLLFSGTSGFTYGQASWRGESDLSGSVYLTRSETDLYICGAIKDDSLMAFDDASADMVAIFFDFRPISGSYFTRDFEAGNGCFSLYIMAPTSTNPRVRVQLGIQTPYEIASIRTETGYTFEMKFPLATFSGWLTKEMKRFGLGVELIDFDNPADPKLSKAIGFLIPSDGVGGPPRPELYGVAEF